MESDPWLAVERAARSHPDAVAVRDADPARVLTYRELVTAAAHRSANLARAGVRGGDRVGVAVRRSPLEVVAVLAVLRLGAVVVALDAGGPRRQVAVLLDVAGVRVVIGHAARLVALGDLLRDRTGVPLTDEPVADVPPTARVAGSAIAWLLDTPGREPVPVTRAEAAALATARVTGTRAGGRRLRLAPLGHEAAIAEIIGTLSRGDTVDVHPLGVVSPDGLAGFVAERGITGLWLSGRLVRQAADYRPDAFGPARELVVYDEPPPDAALARLAAACPGLEITIRPPARETVWVRGVAVDTGHVGDVLRRHPEVRDAVVLTATGDRLVAGCVAANDPSLTAALSAHAAEYLPAEAIPELWAFLDELPPATADGATRLLAAATANDPVRRAARAQLRAARAQRRRTSVAVERSTLELAVRLSWEEVLGLSDFGSDDEFFDVGGNSVGMLRLRGNLRRRLPDHDVTVQDLYRHPTVASLADHLSSGPRS